MLNQKRLQYLHWSYKQEGKLTEICKMQDIKSINTKGVVRVYVYFKVQCMYEWVYIYDIITIKHFRSND